VKIKEINLGELADLIAEGPAGQEKIKKQAAAITTLQETLMLMVKRIRPYEVPVQTKDNIIRFGLISDTHIGSLYQRIDALEQFYLHCEREGIEIILHAGDVVDGRNVYKGQEFELLPNARSWPEQLEMFRLSAPVTENITTYFVSGNHDNSFRKLIGLVAGDEFQRVRPDWKHLGQDTAAITFKAKSGQAFTVQLLHPNGGVAYALSYRLQKIIESISGGQKPNMMVVGHYHKSLYVPGYRNVEGFYPGTFQSQTPLMVQQSSIAQVGGWVVTVTLGDKKKLTSRIHAEWIGFFEGQS
jgi:predicted phosphodiesterase